MCGQPIAEPTRPSRRGDQASSSGAENSRPPAAPPADPSTGHKFRDSSPDRRVYTSALGHSVPSELADAMEAARKERRGALAKSGRRPAPAPKVEPQSPRTDESAGPFTDPEETRKVTLRRPGLPRQRFRTGHSPRQGLLPEVFQSLLWALLLSTLGALVAWGVYVGLRRGAHQQPQLAAQPAPGPAVKSVAAPERARPTLRPAVRPAAGHDLVIPIPASAGGLQAAGAPSSPQVASAPPAAATTPAAAGPRPAPMPHDKSLDDIEFVASNHSPQVRACYDRAFRHAGAAAPAGRVELSFALVDTGEFGRAVEITTELNMLAEPSVSTCLEESIAEWRFPRPPPPPSGAPGASAAPRRLRYPFVFTPAPP